MALDISTPERARNPEEDQRPPDVVRLSRFQARLLRMNPIRLDFANIVVDPVNPWNPNGPQPMDLG
jgi:hypothetical protein